MIAIVDYKCGNLFSLSHSLSYIGAETAVTGDAEIIRSCDRIILPGVGAYEVAMQKLRERGLDKVIIEEAMSGKPLLGICLGMQLLCDVSYEFGIHRGLGLIHGETVDINGLIPPELNLKIPHMGWNKLSFTENGKKNSLLKYTAEGSYFYFVHSYAVTDCGNALMATADYSAPLAAVIASGNVYGVQFHPEKSSGAGLDLLRAFCEVV